MTSKKISSRLQLRKKPQQERSIQRLDAIMEAAVDLIAEHGVANLKMTDIAARAGVPVGSLYQFFPEKAAIIRAFHDRHTTVVQEHATAAFPDVKSTAQAIDMLSRLFDDFYKIYRADRTYLSVWMAGMTDRDFQVLNLAHLDRLTDIVVAALHHLVDQKHLEVFRLRVHMVLYLSGALARFAMVRDEASAQKYLAEWKAMGARTLFEFDG
ncbi:TetR/AcrR family transcriptional regulator [Rhizobium daejeonense]|uniref:TetR/AcrR family transcriptional regulator n=1 Tax=Rhizobium daejeonense TaxID=240521 RepID=A0A6M1S389_9HYPH|nr:TetR/AcrR family transcriptional regulator [Rhizobium daejeonense]NGO63737.1 TetR/AcrR family transcriptional regulator [Rhizobium daejeonense]